MTLGGGEPHRSHAPSNALDYRRAEPVMPPPPLGCGWTASALVIIFLSFPCVSIPIVEGAIRALWGAPAASAVGSSAVFTVLWLVFPLLVFLAVLVQAITRPSRAGFVLLALAALPSIASILLIFFINLTSIGPRD